MTLFEINIAIGLVIGISVMALMPVDFLFVSVWLIALAAWHGNRERIDGAAPRGGPPLLEFLPFVFAIQGLLDTVLHHSGDMVVLFGQLAIIASIVHGSEFPCARIVSCRAVCVEPRPSPACEGPNSTSAVLTRSRSAARTD